MRIHIDALLVGAARPLGGARHSSAIDKPPLIGRIWLGTLASWNNTRCSPY